MIIFSKTGQRPQAEVRDAQAVDVALTLEAGESFEINTPLGALNVERTADTLTIIDWEGMVLVNLESTNGLWEKHHPLNSQEAERRRVEFRTSELRCALPVGTRVKLKVDVERYPHFTAAAGMTGVVAVNDDDLFAVTMDEKLRGAEAWDNQVCWSEEQMDYIGLQVEGVM